MSNIGLDILIRMALEGNGAKVAKEDIDRLKAAAKEATPEAQKAAQAVEAIGKATEKKRPTWKREERQQVQEVTEALKEEKKAVEEVTQAQEEGSKATEEMANETDELVKIFIAAFGATAAFKGISSLVEVAAQAATAKFREIIQEGEEAAARAREIETAYSQIRPLGNAAKSTEEDARTIANAYAELARSANFVGKHLEKINTELLFQQRITQQIDDEKLNAQLAGIQGKVARREMTQSQANIATLAAQREAKERKDARDIELINQQAQSQRMAAEAADKGALAAEGAFKTLGPKLAAQRDASDKAKQDEAVTGKQGKAAIDKLEKELAQIRDAMLQRNMADEGSRLSGIATGGITPFQNPKTFQMAFGNDREALERMEVEKMREISEINAQIVATQKLAKEESDRAAALEKERNDFLNQSKSLEEQRQQYEEQAAALERQHVQLLEAQNQMQSIRNETFQQQLQAAKANEAREKAIRDKKIELEQVEQKIADLPKDSADAAQWLRRKAAIEGEIDRMNARPEEFPLIDQKNRTRLKETEKEIREDSQELLRKQMKGSRFSQVTIDGAEVGDAFGMSEVLDITKQVVGAVRGNNAVVRREIAELRREVSALASQTESLLAG
jgi:hypothetical protein